MTLSNQVSRTEKHAEVVEKILGLLRARGPTLPIHVSSETRLSMIFANAFLSELISQKLVKLSHMRIGSSPLYYLPGQEEMLANFSNHIKGKEREAYDYLQKNGVLRDDELEPAIRVALRNLKDFAHPIQANHDGQSIIFWRFFTLKDEEAKDRIRDLFAPKQHIVKKGRLEEPAITQEKSPPSREKKERRVVRKTEGELEFSKEVKDYLKSNGFEIMQEVEAKRKDAVIKVKTSSSFGEIELLAVCKDKKKVNEADLTLALQRAQSEKLPCLFITPGELNKKGEEYLNQWRNLMFYRRINR